MSASSMPAPSASVFALPAATPRLSATSIGASDASAIDSAALKASNDPTTFTTSTLGIGAFHVVSASAAATGAAPSVTMASSAPAVDQGQGRVGCRRFGRDETGTDRLHATDLHDVRARRQRRAEPLSGGVDEQWSVRSPARFDDAPVAIVRQARGDATGHDGASASWPQLVLEQFGGTLRTRHRSRERVARTR